MNRALLTLTLMTPFLLATANGQTGVATLGYVDEEFLKEMPELPEGRDPFYRPPGRVQAIQPAVPIKVEAVIYSERDPAAIIGGKIVGPGSVISTGVVIKKIGPNFILIDDHGRIREVRLSTNSDRKEK